ncbi:hypothetical protein ACFFQW_34310 [Umezawaea endophytica]|uniref:Uncharacterized protein n=1 Tax=Umezawaea endophytica TaxID=1654476 RepID=A0A9X2VYL4_9PSEU|nr:hypothetical protein [Umezawaea endophytica]MCS7484404.1 hypothetical protein [Umezawaea endophytica]
MAEDLFGNDVPDTSVPAGQPRPVTNDMSAVMTVLGRAEDLFGYVLAGASRQVFRRCGGDRMRPIPRWEAAVVHQLIEVGQLTVGGTHFLRCGAVRGHANSVLMPKTTRLQLGRWRALKNPPSWNKAG